jgi:hypothetical protein
MVYEELIVTILDFVLIILLSFSGVHYNNAVKWPYFGAEIGEYKNLLKTKN